MIILVVVSVIMFAFAGFAFEESGLFRVGKSEKFDAVLIDEVEDEVYDNTGNTKTRFFKVYEYFDGEKNCVVRSEKPMLRITDKVGRKCTICVDAVNRKALEKNDVIYYRIRGTVLIVLGIAVLMLYFYLRTYVPGAAL